MSLAKRGPLPWLLGGACAVIVVSGMREASGILNPMLMAGMALLILLVDVLPASAQIPTTDVVPVETHPSSSPEQQLVEIACAVGAGAKVVIMDEPTASLTRREQERLYAKLLL